MGRVRSTSHFPCHLSVQIVNSTTARKLRHPRLANACDLASLRCDSSKIPLSKMAARRDTNSGHNIRADSPSPPSSRRANKTLQVRIHHRSHGSRVTLQAGRPVKTQRKGTKKGPRHKRAVSEREATRLDWMRRLRPLPHRRC
jgi:hypothetical protein